MGWGKWKCKPNCCCQLIDCLTDNLMVATDKERNTDGGTDRRTEKEEGKANWIIDHN